MKKVLLMALIGIIIFAGVSIAAGTAEVAVSSGVMASIWAGITAIWAGAKDVILPVLIQVIAAVLGMVLIAGVTFGAAWLREHWKNAAIQKVITLAEEYIITRVKANQATIVKDLTAKVAAGTITKADMTAELKKIGENEVEAARVALGPEVLKTIDGFYGDSRKYLSDKLEVVVEDIKKN